MQKILYPLREIDFENDRVKDNNNDVNNKITQKYITESDTNLLFKYGIHHWHSVTQIDHNYNFLTFNFECTNCLVTDVNHDNKITLLIYVASDNVHYQCLIYVNVDVTNHHVRINHHNLVINREVSRVINTPTMFYPTETIYIVE